MSTARKAATKKASTKKAATKKTAPAKKSAIKKASSRTGKDPLATYHAKRDFALTAEPEGRVGATRTGHKQFVVQKHDATRLHYDFRLEHGGVLWSWAVPKGPSLDPKERRLAARTEDHPIDYADFEGVIPEGEYGGGPVIVWDRGTWIPDGDPDRAMKSGRLTFVLEGEKLHGRFHLIRTRTDPRGKEQWLLMKKDDEAASDVDLTRDAPQSVLSGRTVEEVEKSPNRVWHSNRKSGRERIGAKVIASSNEAQNGHAKSQSEDESEIERAIRALPLGFSITSLDKVLYPEDDIRKVHLLAYYASIAEAMLPHVAGRPLTLVRCSEGISKKCFFQKHRGKGTPPPVGSVDIGDDDDEPYMRIDDMPGLVGLGQMGALEIHTWLSHAETLERPDEMIIDLDPDESLPFSRVSEAAFDLRKMLEALGLQTFVKTTGGKGLHVVAPMARKLDWDEHKSLSQRIVEAFARKNPGQYVTNMRKDLRKGRIFLDYLRNGRGATAVAPYSPRARKGAYIATPISWSELEEGVDPKSFTMEKVLTRVQSGSDPWKEFHSLRQSVRKTAMRELER